MYDCVYHVHACTFIFHTYYIAVWRVSTYNVYEAYYILLLLYSLTCTRSLVCTESRCSCTSKVMCSKTFSKYRKNVLPK